jgi:hypothetical protein
MRVVVMMNARMRVVVMQERLAKKNGTRMRVLVMKERSPAKKMG